MELFRDDDRFDHVDTFYFDPALEGAKLEQDAILRQDATDVAREVLLNQLDRIRSGVRY